MRKANERIISGEQENTDEILRSHFLMAKMRGKLEVPIIERPNTTAGGFDRNNPLA